MKKYFRGAALAVLSLAALSVVVTSAYQHALFIADQIVRGDVSMEAGATAKAVSTSTSAADSLIENASDIVLVACWLAGIVDSYRLGVVQNKSDI